jgi:hypothetical protein
MPYPEGSEIYRISASLNEASRSGDWTRLGQVEQSASIQLHSNIGHDIEEAVRTRSWNRINNLVFSINEKLKSP